MDRPVPFFVTGMPRSRTAWLAAWLTTDTTLCLHDSTANALPPVQPGIRAGLSGPEVCMAFRDFTACWPSAPWLVVHRTDAARSFEDVMRRHLDVSVQLVNEWWAQRLKVLHEVTRSTKTMIVDFYQLNDEETAARIWQHLLPEKPIDWARWRMLSQLNIQQQGARRYPTEPMKRRKPN